MAKKRIRIQMKGSLKPVVTDLIEAEEAERLLREEVLPKLGKGDGIGLPGLAVNAKEVASAELFSPGAGTTSAKRRRH